MTTPASWRSSTIVLQVLVAVFGVVPVLGGLAGVIMGPASVAPAIGLPISADSHWRYLSGLLLGLGLGFWSLIANLNENGRMFRLLTGIVVIGGLCRLWSLIEVGRPNIVMTLALIMELIVTPALALWQYQSARLQRP